MRILSVDDNAENRYLMEQMLHPQGHDVTSASNGMEALEKLEKQTFDLIIADILMPGMDGYQLCHEVKSRERTRRIPFIFYTATYTERKDEELGLSLGASRFVMKPSDPDEFMTIVDEVIRETRQKSVPVPEEGHEPPLDYLAAYNARLVHKMDRKIVQLEAAQSELRESLAARDREIAQRQQLEEENRHLERQLAHAQKMEAIGQLAGGVAHDFNNLLTVILGYAHLLEHSHSPLDPATEHVREIVKAADRAATLTRQLLAFSRKQDLQLANVDINSVIRQSENMLRRLIGEDIEFRIEYAPEELRALVDPGQVVQVIMNLAVNARDAMPEGGVLTIRTEPAEITAEHAPSHPEGDAGPYVQLLVRDTGVGMDSATRARAFEPFFTTKPPGAGTGLGLSTVYGIVRQCNGHIQVESEAGSGTCFRISLPRLSERPEPAPAESRPVRETGNQTILVVEDDRALRKLVCAALRLAGYKVIDAASGGDALLACERTGGEIALLVTDMVMPGMSGRHLAQRVSAQWPEIKVLFMSGYSRMAAPEGLAAGEQFIGKPFKLDHLADRVRAVLNSQGKPA